MIAKEDAVLFVDDELNILNAIRRAVTDENFQSFYANSAKEALKIMAEQEIAVIVTDMRMPEMDGLQLLKIVKNDYPDTVRMVLSGYTQLSQVLATVNQADIFNFITKPWDSDLNRMIYKAIDYHHLKKMEAEMKATLGQRNTAYKNMMAGMEAKMADQEYRLEAITQIGKYLKEAPNPIVANHLLKLLLEYSQESAKETFDLSKEGERLASWLKAQMDNTEAKIVAKQELTGQVKGDRLLLQSAIESLFLSEEIAAQIRHIQITLKKADDDQALLEIDLITDTVIEQWRNWLAFWSKLAGKEHALQIKELKHKENHIVHLQFSFVRIGG